MSEKGPLKLEYMKQTNQILLLASNLRMGGQEGASLGMVCMANLQVMNYTIN